MSHVLLLRCDQQWPDRTPHRCTAYLPVQSVDTFPIEADGWQVDEHGYATCPSCARARQDTPPA